MPAFSELLNQGAANAYLFIPSAILLGALHGLEPGHSKTLMAAFIVAIRGTVGQAVLLGLAATISHTAVVWAIALTGMYLYQGVDAETVEPYFQLVSGVVIVALAAWMIWRTRQDRIMAELAAGDLHADHHDENHHDHDHDHGHGHHHDYPHGEDTARNHGNVRLIDTGHGLHRLELAGEDAEARWRFSPVRGKPWSAGEVMLTTERPGGGETVYRFAARDGYIESADPVSEPHDFMVRISLGYGDHSHDFDVSFLQSADGRDPMHEELRGLDLGTDGYQDAHELAHANDIRRRFAGQRNVTNWQILLFGLTGGMIPCPAAITVLLLCIQLREIALGAVLVLAFSVGLAITLVGAGAAAAIGMRHASRRIGWFSTFAQRAPYVSGVLLILVGLYVGLHGLSGIA